MAGSECISARVRSCSFDGPPSTRYDASVYGAPANPMSGVSPSSATVAATASRMGASARGVERGEGRDIRRRPHRVLEHGTAAGDDAHVDAGQLDRDDDVAEEDRGIHAVPTDRLQGDLARELGREAGLEHVGADAQLAVFRQRTAGLPHEPHRSRLGAIPAICPEEGSGVSVCDSRMRSIQWHTVNITYVLLCLTANHRNASLDILERLSVGAPAATRALVDDELFVSGAVVLATCNRFEAYLDIDEPLTGGEAVAVESVVEAMASASGILPESLRASVAVHEGADAAAHLFAVTSGLESVVVGEEEISGQVRRALDAARADGTSSSDLERLFQKAAHTSRGVRSQTRLRGTHSSLVRLALELASSRIADWSTRARADRRHRPLRRDAPPKPFAVSGPTDLHVFSPSGRAAAFATKHGLIAESSFPDAAAVADVVITCTADAVVHADAFTPGRRVVVIDLGLPRNVDPSVGRVAGVELLDLETIRLHAPLEEFSAHADARALVGDAVAEFAADRAAGPAITALRQDVLRVVEDEISRARAHGAGDDVEAALRHLAGVLLHRPSLRIRELAVEGRIDEVHSALGTLGLEVENDPPAAMPWSETA